MNLPINKKIWYYLRAFYGISLALGDTKILGHKKTREYVKTVYNEKLYKKFLQDRSWTKIKTLEEYVSTNFFYPEIEKNTIHDVLLNGKLHSSTDFECTKIMRKLYADNLKNYLNSNAVIELGCGTGRNLFSLRAFGFKNNMEGYDISENAIKLCRLKNDYFDSDIKFDTLDLTTELESLGTLKNKIVFSSHCLEQLKRYTDKIILDLIKLKPKRVIHFEPVPELYAFSMRDIIARIYNYAHDYQNNLLVTLKKYEKRKMIKIMDAHRLGTSMNPLNETTLINWIPA